MHTRRNIAKFKFNKPSMTLGTNVFMSRLKTFLTSVDGTLQGHLSEYTFICGALTSARCEYACSYLY